MDVVEARQHVGVHRRHVAGRLGEEDDGLVAHLDAIVAIGIGVRHLATVRHPHLGDAPLAGIAHPVAVVVPEHRSARFFAHGRQHPACQNSHCHPFAHASPPFHGFPHASLPPHALRDDRAYDLHDYISCGLSGPVRQLALCRRWQTRPRSPMIRRMASNGNTARPRVAPLRAGGPCGSSMPKRLPKGRGFQDPGRRRPPGFLLSGP